MIPSSTTNSSIMNTNDRKRRGVSLSNSKKIRRSELPKTERLVRSTSISENHRSQDYSDKNRFSTFKQINDSYQKNEKRDNGLNTSYESDEDLDEIKTTSTKLPSVVVSPIITSTDLQNSSTKLFKLVVPQTPSIKMLSDGVGVSSALRIPTKIQLTKTLSTASVNQEPSTTVDNTQKEQAVGDYPLTPPPPVIDHSQNTKSIKSIDSEQQIISKRHSLSLLDCSVPPTSELSPTSLTSSSPDDSFVELDYKINQISSSSIKRRYRSLSFSCPILPYCPEKLQPITPPYKSKSLSRISNLTNKKVRSISPVIKYSSIERLKRRRRDHQNYGKRLKFKPKTDDETVADLLNEMIEQIQSTNDNTQLKNLEESRSTLTESSHSNIPKPEFETKGEECVNHQDINNEQKIILQRSKKSNPDETLPLLSTDNSLSTELKRQTSTPLSFHSIPSSDQSINSPQSVSKTHIFTDIVNELIKGAKGLDKLSCSLVNFTNSIHNFIRLTIEKQTERVEDLQHELEKKCSSQLTRANIFCTKKIQYFLSKHSIISINEYVNEITLIVKYFYLYVLFLNYRKQENEFELILTDLINGKSLAINELNSSPILTTIIEDFILTSSLANEYLSSQPILLNQIEYSLPFIRNLEYENELLSSKNDFSLMTNPFSDSNDLEEYLHSCEHISTIIPPHPSTYYPPPGQYYYPPTPSSDSIPYYYQSPYQQSYGYNHPSSYYTPLTSYNEQYNYYYNQQTSYDIPLSYRRVNSNVQKKYSNLPLENQTSAIYEPPNIGSPQSKSANPMYPS